MSSIRIAWPEVAPLPPYRAMDARHLVKRFCNSSKARSFPALHRLEAKGWLAAEWKATDTGGDAKFYSLTRAGRRRLESERENWVRLTQATRLVLQTAG